MKYIAVGVAGCYVYLHIAGMLAEEVERQFGVVVIAAQVREKQVRHVLRLVCQKEVERLLVR